MAQLVDLAADRSGGDRTLRSVEEVWLKRRACPYRLVGRETEASHASETAISGHSHAMA